MITTLFPGPCQAAGIAWLVGALSAVAQVSVDGFQKCNRHKKRTDIESFSENCAAVFSGASTFIFVIGVWRSNEAFGAVTLRHVTQPEEIFAVTVNLKPYGALFLAIAAGAMGLLVQGCATSSAPPQCG
ncbi:hypothetical protein ACFSHP_05530 [Novosphingobium panipatense]